MPYTRITHRLVLSNRAFKQLIKVKIIGWRVRVLTVEQQCEIARQMTGCKSSNEEILKNIRTMNELVKEEASILVNRLLLRDNLPFDKAFLLAKSDFNKVAQKYKINSAALFWVYMEWKGRQR